MIPALLLFSPETGPIPSVFLTPNGTHRVCSKETIKVESRSKKQYNITDEDPREPEVTARGIRNDTANAQH